jgi:hypothetical protein
VLFGYSHGHQHECERDTADVNEVALPTLETIKDLQAAMAKLPQVKLETKHYFADGMYARELFRPAGTTIVGKVHKKEHFYIVMYGDLVIAGDGYKREVSGPAIFVSEPGTKRAVYAQTDALCVTVHRVSSTDLDEIEAEVVEEDKTALFNARNELKFDPVKFRALTQKIIAGEKPGFWSDWTTEQQELYTAGNWNAFSSSRGYSSESIAEYQQWLDMIKVALNAGINPYSYTIDLATKAALANMARAGSHEILKSSHLPFTSRENDP